MNLFDTTQIALERAVSGAAMRHEALAGNIANVNTPGYRRRDVDFHATLREAMATGQEAAVERAPLAVQVSGAQAMRADGNTVDLDAESARLAENSLEYDALVSVARVRNEILRSAIGHF